ncbi:MAG: hypothetical protein GX096_01830 [Clostridiales bacterium]|nr:hypothetical protein [Clostridiales bacterium]
MDVTFPLLGLTGHAYGLCTTVGALFMLVLMGIFGYRKQLPPGTVRVFGLIAIPIGIIGARLAYCLLNYEIFIQTYENPWLMFAFYDGGLSMTGLLCGLVLAAWITARLMKVRFAALFDVMSVPLGLFIACARFGERFTDIGIGKVVEPNGITRLMPWLFVQSQAGINIEFRMAVFIYEAIAGIILFAVMLWLFFASNKNKNARQGDLGLLCFTIYGASQTILESLRDDGHMLIIFLRVAQVAAALMPVLATMIFAKRYRHISGKGGKRIILTWLAVLVCVAGLIFLEFSLDGRITWGAPSMLRDYGIMAVLCILLCAMPCSLYHTLSRCLYRQDHMNVSIPQAEDE